MTLTVRAAPAAAGRMPVLGALRAGQAGLVGAKAARLGDLIGAGFRVPDGFVLIPETYRVAMTDAGIQDRLTQLHRQALDAATHGCPLAAPCAAAATAVRTAALPAGLLAELTSAYERLPDDTGRGAVVAVRPSGLDQDVDIGHSTATATNVRGIDELAEAVRGCWASVFGTRQVVARAAARLTAEPAVAVIVQLMVPAQRAGTAFTVDPFTDDPDLVLVEAAYGLGEVVVSGAVEPDRYWLRGPLARLVSLHVGDQTHQVVRGRDGHDLTVPLCPAWALERVLDDQAAREVARTALRVQRHWGGPVEVEWAMVARQLSLLAVRPIVTPGPSR